MLDFGFGFSYTQMKGVKTIYIEAGVPVSFWL